MECEKCRKNYPDRFIQPLYVQGGYIRVDPECALEIMTEVHGHKFSGFKGEEAQDLYESFKKYKKKEKKNATT